MHGFMSYDEFLYTKYVHSNSHNSTKTRSIPVASIGFDGVEQVWRKYGDSATVESPTVSMAIWRDIEDTILAIGYNDALRAIAPVALWECTTVFIYVLRPESLSREVFLIEEDGDILWGRSGDGRRSHGETEDEEKRFDEHNDGEEQWRGSRVTLDRLLCSESS